MSNLLEGIRVVEFGQLVAVPSAGQLLADLGADVIKVEPPSGDPARTMPAPSAGRFRVGSTFLAYNVGKRSVAIDLKRTEGVAVARRLVTRADVVIENLRPGVLDALCLGAVDSQAANPSLVYGSVVGYGPGHPNGPRKMVDNLAQAHSGMMAANGPDGGEPHRVGFTVVDAAAGLALAHAVTAALFQRERSGLGARVVVPLVDTGIFLQAAPFADYLATSVEPQRMGNASALAAPSGIFRTADGMLMLVAYIDRDWRRLLSIAGRDELADDPRFEDSTSRLRHRHALTEELERTLKTRTTAAWIEDLQAADIMAAEVRTYGEVVEHESWDRGAIQKATADAPFRVHGPLRFDHGPQLPDVRVPGLSQHGAEILVELGYLDWERDLLLTTEVVLDSSANASVLT